MSKLELLNSFIDKAKKIHGDLYDYSMVYYKNNKTKVKILCSTHGVFEQAPANHTNQKQGCPKCNMITTEIFIERAIKVHGDLYDYSKTVYLGGRNKVEIVCREHGSFHQSVSNHLRGSGCRKCAIERSRYTLEEYLEKAREFHGDKYDYSNVKYKSLDDKIVIKCREHGEFEMRAINHILKDGKAQGCRECRLRKRGEKQRSGRADSIVADFRKVHGDRYDYSKSDYRGLHVDMKITCRVHGVFMARPSNHLSGTNCPSCYSDRLKEEGANNRISNEEFITRAKQRHGELYDYSSTNFTGMHFPITVICREHGEFTQSKALNHLNNDLNCPVCLELEMMEIQLSRRTTFEEAQKMVYEIHRDTIEILDYSKYEGTESKIPFKCNRHPKHGEFHSSLHSVSSGTGCPVCSMSRGERQILFYLNDRGIKSETQKYFKETGKKRFDFYLPELNIVIEFNGRQHYESIKAWGGEKGLIRVQESDKIKKHFCIDKGIRFEVIRYDENLYDRLEEILP